MDNAVDCGKLFAIRSQNRNSQGQNYGVIHKSSVKCGKRRAPAGTVALDGPQPVETIAHAKSTVNPVGAGSLSRVTWFTFCEGTWFTLLLEQSRISIQQVSTLHGVDAFVQMNSSDAKLSKNKSNLSRKVGFAHSDLFIRKAFA